MHASRKAAEVALPHPCVYHITSVYGPPLVSRVIPVMHGAADPSFLEKGLAKGVCAWVQDDSKR